jgi:hypothetical protein
MLLQIPSALHIDRRVWIVAAIRLERDCNAIAASPSTAASRIQRLTLTLPPPRSAEQIEQVATESRDSAGECAFEVGQVLPLVLKHLRDRLAK